MRFSLLAAVVLCASSLAAHADTIESYQLNAATTGGGSITGTFSIDETNSALSTSTLSFLLGSSTTLLPIVSGTGSVFGTLPTATFESLGSPSTLTFLSLIFTGGSVIKGSNTVSFAGLTGVCVQGSTGCSGSYSEVAYPGGGVQSLTSATLTSLGSVTTTPASVTPEPSSFVLLGTGLLGVVGSLRKRFA